MEAPLGLPNSLRDLIERSRDGNDLYQTVKEAPIEQIIELFDCAIDDSTWIEERGGLPFIQQIIPFLNSLALRKSLPFELLKIVALGIRRTIKHTMPFLVEDIIFEFEEGKISANSLLFRFFGGQYFSDLIDDYIVNRKSHVIKLTGLSKKVFGYVKEYIYTHSMEDLWKENPEVILSLQRKANKWGLKELSTECFQVYKNYVSQEVFLKRLFTSFEEKNIHLTHELLEIFNHKEEDLKLTLSPFNWFSVELYRLNFQVFESLQSFCPLIISIVCKTGLIDEELLVQLIKRSSRLEELDLSSLENCLKSQEMMEALPGHLRSLKLKNQQWVDGEVIEQMKRLKALRTLDLTRCENYPLKKLTEFEELKELQTLILSGNQQLNEREMRLLAPLICHVRALGLSRCQGVTDEVIEIIVEHFKELEALNLSSCQKLTPEGILRLIQIPTLRKLNIKNIKSIPINFKEKYQSRFWALSKFQI